MQDPSRDLDGGYTNLFNDPFLVYHPEHKHGRCVPNTYGAAYKAVKFTVTGTGVASVTAGQRVWVDVAYTGASAAGGGARAGGAGAVRPGQVVLAIRLVGPSIIALDKPGDPLSTSSPQRGSYTAQEPGMYLLEVVLTYVAFEAQLPKYYGIQMRLQRHSTC